jgi:hypothetical protein
MRVLLAISVFAFLGLVWACIGIALHIYRYRTRKNRDRAVPAEPPRNLANPL